jgi:uncharacterized protein DUF1707/2TM domain-containing protein
MSRLTDARTDVIGLTASRVDGVRTMRAGDEDRRRVADLLQRHYVAGRLTSEELAERIGRSLDARTLGDLDALLQDLPSAEAHRGEGRGRQQGRVDPCEIGDHAWMAGHGALRGDRSFKAHATSYVLVMALLVTIWLLTTPGGYFWPIWPALGWGLGLASHGLAARAASDRSPTAALR